MDKYDREIKKLLIIILKGFIGIVTIGIVIIGLTALMLIAKAVGIIF